MNDTMMIVRPREPLALRCTCLPLKRVAFCVLSLSISHAQAGSLPAGGSIVQSYATGDVTGPLHVEPGGLVGDNTGFISQSYSTGKAQGGMGGGGLVYSNEGTINESFDVGLVNAYSPAGMAYLNTGTITSVYCDRQTTGQISGGNGVPVSHGLSTAQMSDPASFTTWNFGAGGAWSMPVGATHPVLAWQQAQ